MASQLRYQWGYRRSSSHCLWVHLVQQACDLQVASQVVRAVLASPLQLEHRLPLRPREQAEAEDV
jgi:hypothetical protein